MQRYRRKIYVKHGVYTLRFRLKDMINKMFNHLIFYVASVSNSFLFCTYSEIRSLIASIVFGKLERRTSNKNIIVDVVTYSISK